MAQHTPVQLSATRVPMMDGAALDARTRPLDRPPTSVWLRHRLSPVPAQRPVPVRLRAREWLGRMAGRSAN